MHQHLINASIQIIPVAQDRHPYAWVDEAIVLIQGSGIQYEVGPFSTALEGTYDEVMKLIHDINELLYRRGCAEWIANIQLQIRASADVTSLEKTAKFKTAH